MSHQCQYVPVFCVTCGPFTTFCGLQAGRGSARCPECGKKIEFAWGAAKDAIDMIWAPLTEMIQ